MGRNGFRGLGVAAGQLGAGGPQLGRAHHRDIAVESADQRGQPDPGPGAQTGPAAGGAQGGDDRAAGRPAGDVGGRRVQQHLAAARPVVDGVAAVELADDEGRDVVVRQPPGRESAFGGGLGTDPVGPKRPPFAAAQVPGHQVPASAPHHQVMRFHLKRRRFGRAGSARIAEPQHPPVAHRPTDGVQHLRLHCGCRQVPRVVDGGHRYRVDPVPQPGRQHLPDRGQGPGRGRVGSAHRRQRGPQRHRQRHRLLGVEGRRRTLAGHQPVLTTRPESGRHRVTESPQPIHVTPHRAGADRQPPRQLGRRPATARTQQRHQPQQPRRSIFHAAHAARKAGHFVSASVPAKGGQRPAASGATVAP